MFYLHLHGKEYKVSGDPRNLQSITWPKLYNMIWELTFHTPPMILDLRNLIFIEQKGVDDSHLFHHPVLSEFNPNCCVSFCIDILQLFKVK